MNIVWNDFFDNKIDRYDTRNPNKTIPSDLHSLEFNEDETTKPKRKGSFCSPFFNSLFIPIGGPGRKEKVVGVDGTLFVITKKVLLDTTVSEFTKLCQILHNKREVLFIEKLFFDKGKKDFDDFRRQANLQRILANLTKQEGLELVRRVFSNLRKEIERYISQKYTERYTLSPGNVLISKPGGVDQVMHRDYQSD